jgi:predicted amidophosphoribosyltransferase
MALRKCPRCELNYVREGEDYCDVCKRELKRARAREKHADEEELEEEEVLMCTECGEAPAVHGSELCAACLKEQKRQAELENAVDLDPELEEASEDDE